MKCFVLAGGSGDALWPLSRKNYPKQFIYVREGRSLFQEAIARNLPFCDEFFIITNIKYRYIVEGQMQAFQGLSYRCFLEEIGRQTAPAVTIASMCVDKEEEVLVVSTDHLVGEGDYNGTIVRAKELLKEDNIVVVGCHAETMGGHSVFAYEGHSVTKFISGEEVTAEDKILLDSGIFLMRAGTYLKAIKENVPGLYEMCWKGNDRIRLDREAFVINRPWLLQIPSLSIGECVFRKWAGSHVDIVEGDFIWSRLLNHEVLTELEPPSLQGPSIRHQCHNVSILNEDKQKLVVANGCEDLLIVNTKDAAYISQKGESAAIKEIMAEHYEEHSEIFDEGDIFYTTWGIKETLNRSEGYMVKKLTIFPGKSLTMHKHEQRSEHWSIVSGTASIIINGSTKEYSRNHSVFVPVNTFHKIENKTANDLIVIEVSVGTSAGIQNADIQQAVEEFVRLQPAYKDYLWGGQRLREIFGKGVSPEYPSKIAESWEVSAHSAGNCTIAEGDMKGMTFSEYLKYLGKDALGWKCQPFEKFPLLIKFIDATHPLSVQVHPDDAYAMSVEGDYGKNEMWYILDAEPDASIYLGFQREISKEECIQRVKDGSLTDVLKQIHVKKGDVIFVKAGTVHAILDGLLILEIQQSSNATYRLYDYDREDETGKKRQLHLKKAFENIDFKSYEYDLVPAGEREEGNGCVKQLLGECKYFSSTLYEVEKETELSLDDASFSAIVFLSGAGEMKAGEKKSNFSAGDSFFIPAGKKALRIKGNCSFVLSKV
jgi:mannose-1-phosphate guanylyltransferase/mannose-6-phosphate isomerase